MKKGLKTGVLSSLFIMLFIGLLSNVNASWFNKNPQSTETSDAQSIESQPFTFTTFRDIAKEESPTVVNISTTTIIKRNMQRSPHQFQSPFEDFFGDEFFRQFFGDRPMSEKVQSLGSGVIIDPEGYILTNNHVIQDVDEIKVTTLDGKTYDAKVVGKDDETDIALIKVEPEEPLKSIPLGDSDILEVGDWVMAIGNPFGFGHTITVGVVSAKGRSLVMPYDELPYQDFIQTDASINPGNSGGPLLDVHGRLVGINTVIASKTGQSAGIGFAIPINMIKNLLDDLKDKGVVIRGWLGVTIQTLTDDLAKNLGLSSTKGALISEVVEDSPADKAGIQKMDVVISYDNVEIKDSGHLSRMVAGTSVDKEINITVIREGKEKKFTVDIGERPKDLSNLKAKTDGVSSDFGMTIQEITPDMAHQLGIKKSSGVLIADIEPGSPADKAGLQRQDIILEINKQKITSIGDYHKAMESLTSTDGAILYVLRGDSRIFVAIRPNESKK